MQRGPKLQKATACFFAACPFRATVLQQRASTRSFLLLFVLNFYQKWSSFVSSYRNAC